MFCEFIHLQVTTEAALGLVGGTMGLLTGFSILSGVEIIYYLIRLNLCIEFTSIILEMTLQLFIAFHSHIFTPSQVLHVTKSSLC